MKNTHTVGEIMSRIKSAEPHSPIDVFINKDDGDSVELEAAFAGTVYADKRRELFNEWFVGRFDKTSNMLETEKLLKEARFQ